MENKISTGLKAAIQQLEAEQTSNGKLLKEQFFVTYEHLKPVNLLTRTLKEVATSPSFMGNILGAALGLASGYYTKKMVVGASGSVLRRIFGSILQIGVTNLVARQHDAVKSIGHFIFQHILRKRNAKLKTEISK